jgi:hypothetical protein
MPWTEITRAEYRRGGLRYASDMTDAEWALIARRIPPRRRLRRVSKDEMHRGLMVRDGARAPPHHEGIRRIKPKRQFLGGAAHGLLTGRLYG